MVAAVGIRVVAGVIVAMFVRVVFMAGVRVVVSMIVGVVSVVVGVVAMVVVVIGVIIVSVVVGMVRVMIMVVAMFIGVVAMVVGVVVFMVVRVVVAVVTGMFVGVVAMILGMAVPVVRCMRRVVMDRLDAGQGDVNGPVHWRPGWRKDARDRERQFVVVLEADVADAMRDHDAVANDIAETISDFRPQHGITDARQTGSRHKLKTLLPTVAVVLEIRLRCAEHAVAAVRISKRQRDCPRDLGALRDGLVTVPTDAARGVADPEHRIQQQVEGPAACPHNQIRTGDRVRESSPRLGPNPVDAGQQRDAHGH